MILDRDICALCAAIYAGPAGTAWDHYDAGQGDGVVWALKRYDAGAVVVLRGSSALLDWLRDFDFWQNPFAAPSVRDVYPGFYLGMAQVWRELAALIESGEPVIVTGHSLGAARAAVLSALMALDGRPPAARVTFGEPKPGGEELAARCLAVPARIYRNGDSERHAHDLVTDVPFTGQHDRPMIDVYAAPSMRAIGDVLDPFRFHHIELYQAGLSGITTGT